MTVHEIAEKYAFKPGFRLIDCMEVGLPAYHVILQVSTLVRKKIAPLDEFAMRCLKFGMRDCDEISAFLGLDRRIVESVVSGLIRDNDVALSGQPSSSEQALKLTVKGQKSLDLAETIIPEDKTIALFFDALLRQPAYYREQLFKAKEMREAGLKEIQSIPARQPKVADFPIEQVQELLRKSVGTGEKRDLLSIKRVERCNKLFRRAVALLYRSLEGGEPYVEFVVDGKLTSDYGAAFTRADGLKFLGLEYPADPPLPTSLSVQRPEADRPPSNESDGAGRVSRWRSSPLPAHGASSAASNESDGSLVVLQAESADVLATKAEIVETKNAIEQTSDDSTRNALEERLREAESKLAELEEKQKRRGVRQVYVYEHPRLLDTALKSCKTRLMIISPWIRAQVVNPDFLKKVKDALERGVMVYIGYGISSEEQGEPRKADKEAEEKLGKLAKRLKNFQFCRFGDTHAKVLICDAKFSVTGSFNWLSFKGDPDRTFRDEQSVLVEIQDHVEGVFRENLKRFESQPSAHDGQ
jgi:phospholipase D-like protein